MRIPILTAIVLATLATSAGAQPRPVPQEDVDRPVSINVHILDAAGSSVGTRACDWAVGGPGDDDRQCLRFQSDPQFAFEAIEEAGGVRAEQHTVAANLSDMRTSWSRRGDGTWLIRGKGTVRGEPRHFGLVCTRDGQKCVRWDAEGARQARRDVQAAAAKLRRS
jgi:hypothetical protein